MKIGELFVGLGVKGQGKAMEALKSVRGGLSSVATTSLKTKAAIAATFFAIERMNRFAGNMGAGLHKFSKLTGMSAEQLQKYQYAARQANITNEEMESTFKNIQQTIGDMLIGKGAPEGIKIVGDTVGLDYDRLDDTAYIMQKLQKFANEFQGDVTLANSAIRSFGVPDSVIAGFRQMAFTQEKMAAARIISQGDVSRLSKMNAQVSELYNNVKLTIAQVLSKFMPEIIQGVTSLDKAITNMIDGFLKSKEAIEGIKIIIVFIKDAFVGMAKIMHDSLRGVKIISDYFKGGSFSEGISKFGSDMFQGLRGMVTGKFTNDDIIPRGTISNSSSNNTNNVRNEINIQGDVNNPQELGSEIQNALNGTFWQMNQGAVK